MELVDTHCHLFLPPLWQDLEGVLARARDVGVGQIVVPAYDVASWDLLDDLRGRAGVHLAFGLHPWVAGEDLDLAVLRRALIDSQAVAVGEVGLDFAIPDADRARQLSVLRSQLDLARELDLPVLLHCRGAFEELITLLTSHTPHLRGVLHAFSRSPQLAQRFVDLGLHIAFGGAVTRPRAERARASAAAVDARHLLLETDAPSIGLDGVPPAQTEPCHVAAVARCLAELRGDSVEEIARVTTENAFHLFGIGPRPAVGRPR
ncbi:MAG: TatD family hydrolase [Pseudomonadota bacterium]